MRTVTFCAAIVKLPVTDSLSITALSVRIVRPEVGLRAVPEGTPVLPGPGHPQAVRLLQSAAPPAAQKAGAGATGPGGTGVGPGGGTVAGSVVGGVRRTAGAEADAPVEMLWSSRSADADGSPVVSRVATTTTVRPIGVTRATRPGRRMAER